MDYIRWEVKRKSWPCLATILFQMQVMVQESLIMLKMFSVTYFHYWYLVIKVAAIGPSRHRDSDCVLNWSGRVPPAPPLSLPRYDLQTRIGGLSDPRSDDKISTHRAIATISLSYIYSPPSKQHILETNISASWIIKFRLLQSFAARPAVSRFLQQKLHMWHTYEIKVNLDRISWQSDRSRDSSSSSS